MARGIKGSALAGINLTKTDDVGNAMGAALLVFHKAWTAGTGTFDVVSNLPFKVKVLNFKCIPTASSAGAVMKLTDGTNTIADISAGTGLDVATIDVVAVDTLIDSTYATKSKGAKLVLSLTDATGTSTGDAFVYCVRIED